jgi:hypothetical protein
MKFGLILTRPKCNQMTSYICIYQRCILGLSPKFDGVTQCPGLDVKWFIILISAMTIKRSIQPKFRLPILNWAPLKPQQVKGTVFADLNDEKLMKLINFNDFEDSFRIGGSIVGTDEVDNTPRTLRRSRKPSCVSLLESQRTRNVGKSTFCDKYSTGLCTLVYQSVTSDIHLFHVIKLGLVRPC